MHLAWSLRFVSAGCVRTRQTTGSNLAAWNSGNAIQHTYLFPFAAPFLMLKTVKCGVGKFKVLLRETQALCSLLLLAVSRVAVEKRPHIRCWYAERNAVSLRLEHVRYASCRNRSRSSTTGRTPPRTAEDANGHTTCFTYVKK